jgi:hypothetical protein
MFSFFSRRAKQVAPADMAAPTAITTATRHPHTNLPLRQPPILHLPSPNSVTAVPYPTLAHGLGQQRQPNRHTPNNPGPLVLQSRVRRQRRTGGRLPAPMQHRRRRNHGRGRPRQRPRQHSDCERRRLRRSTLLRSDRRRLILPNSSTIIGPLCLWTPKEMETSSQEHTRHRSLRTQRSSARSSHPSLPRSYTNIVLPTSQVPLRRTPPPTTTTTPIISIP